MSPTAPAHVDPRPLAEIPEAERDKAETEALAEARRRWGKAAAVHESADLVERRDGHIAHVGIVRIIRHERRGFRPKDERAFVALGRGKSWAEAFTDSDATKAKIEQVLGRVGIDELNEAYTKNPTRFRDTLGLRLREGLKPKG